MGGFSGKHIARYENTETFAPARPGSKARCHFFLIQVTETVQTSIATSIDSGK